MWACSATGVALKPRESGNDILLSNPSFLVCKPDMRLPSFILPHTHLRTEIGYSLFLSQSLSVSVSLSCFFLGLRGRGHSQLYSGLIHGSVLRDHSYKGFGKTYGIPGITLV